MTTAECIKVSKQDVSPANLETLENDLFWLFVEGDAKAGAIDARLTKAIRDMEFAQSFEEEFELAYAVIAANEHLAEIGVAA